MTLIRVCAGLLLAQWLAAQTTGAAPVDRLAQQLIGAPDAAGREALIAANPEAVNAALVKAITTAGNAQYGKNAFEEALRIYAIAGELAGPAHDVRGLAMSQNNTGSALMRLSREDDALAYLLEAAKGFAAVPDHASASRAWNNIGLIRLHTNDFAGSQQAYTNAAAEDEASGLAASRLITMMDLANLYNFWGKLDLAAEKLNQTLALAREVHSDRDVALALGTLAGTYSGMHDYTLALNAAEESLRLRRQLGEHQLLSNLLDEIGQIHFSLGHQDLARSFFEQALKEAAEQKDEGSRTSILCDYGYLLWMRMHDAEGAIRQFQEALKTATAINRGLRASEARVGLALIAISQSHWQDAVDWSRPGLEFGKQTDDAALIEIAASPLAQGLEGLGRKAEAEAAWLDCIGAIETQQEHAAGAQETRAQFMNDRQTPYARLASLLQGEGRIEAALAVTEKGKARVILETLRNGRVEVDRVLTAEERKRETALQSRIVTLRTRGAAAPLAQARTEYRDFRNALYAAHPELRVQRMDMEPVTPAAVMAAFPDPDAVVLEYVAYAGQVRLYAVTRGPNGAEAHAYTIAGKFADLSAQVAAFRLQLASRYLGFRDLAQSLYRVLVAPAAAQLRGKRTLVIVPDGFLWGLPFQALQPSPDRFLVEDHPLFYAPSLTVLHAMIGMERGKPARAGSVLAVGNTQVAGSQLEMAGLQEIYGAAHAKVYFGSETDWRRIREEAAHYDVLHISAHGVFRDDDPMSSYLLIGPEESKTGRLEARDILNLSIRARLVVLAACETARGEASGGEGLIGMSWALFAAGSPATVASQFPVDSASTKELMLHFHRHLHDTGHMAQALQQAALETMKQPQFRHPFYWAGFLAMGYGF